MIQQFEKTFGGIPHVHPHVPRTSGLAFVLRQAHSSLFFYYEDFLAPSMKNPNRLFKLKSDPNPSWRQKGIERRRLKALEHGQRRESWIELQRRVSSNRGSKRGSKSRPSRASQSQSQKRQIRKLRNAFRRRVLRPSDLQIKGSMERSEVGLNRSKITVWKLFAKIENEWIHVWFIRRKNRRKRYIF